MLYFYNVFIFLFLALLNILRLFQPSLQKMILVRRYEKKAILKIKPFSSSSIWLHGASVGELDQCKALAEEIKRCNPKIPIIQSVFSDSVSFANLKHEAFDFTFHLPFDIPHAYDFIFTIFRPKILIIMAWDTWPNLIVSAKKHGVKTILASASLNPASGRLKGLAGKLTKTVFSHIDRIYPASDLMKTFFSTLVPMDKIGMSGDTRFDSVRNKIKNTKPDVQFNAFAHQYPKGTKIIILASTYNECDQVVLSAIPKNENLVFWIFPHKINQNRLHELEQHLLSRDISFEYFSEIQKQTPRVVVFDKLGILAHAYQYGYLAYIGGALHHRVHNVIEPAFFGLPLITGNKISNSPEAMVLHQSHGLFTIKSEAEFQTIVKNVLHDKPLMQRIHKNNKSFVLSGTGYAKKLCKEILQ